MGVRMFLYIQYINVAVVDTSRTMMGHIKYKFLVSFILLVLVLFICSTKIMYNCCWEANALFLVHILCTFLQLYIIRTNPRENFIYSLDLMPFWFLGYWWSIFSPPVFFFFLFLHIILALNKVIFGAFVSFECTFYVGQQSFEMFRTHIYI